jgi:tRNA pseudouridine38-40 synthase
VALSVAGRTDAGVHARHQVASFPFDGELDIAALVRSLRTMLGSEISIHEIGMVPDGFDARFSAIRRSYRYFIDETPWHDPLQARWVWHRGEPLDVDAMNLAAAAFVGEHDFAALCRAADNGTTERTVDFAHWARVVSEEGAPAPSSPFGGGNALLVYSVSAHAFCHQMVRSMVALCVDVGRGRLAPEAVPGILEGRDRNASRGVAPAHGLVLWEVSYEL